MKKITAAEKFLSEVLRVIYVIVYSLVSCFTETVEFEPPGSESEAEENEDDDDESEGEGLWPMIFKMFTCSSSEVTSAYSFTKGLAEVDNICWLDARVALVCTCVVSITEDHWIIHSLVNAPKQAKLPIIISSFSKIELYFLFFVG